jgi:hypothetical protein
MPLINNKEEFEEFYPYDKNYITEYPKEYPCVAKWEYEDCGLMGDKRQVYVAYFPKDVTLEDAFIKGLFYSWNYLK